MSKSNKQRFGLFYKSHGNWTGPYGGMTFTKYAVTRNPVKSDLELLKKVLKSRVQVRPVQS